MLQHASHVMLTEWHTTLPHELAHHRFLCVCTLPAAASAHLLHKGVGLLHKLLQLCWSLLLKPECRQQQNQEGSASAAVGHSCWRLAQLSRRKPSACASSHTYYLQR